jgi:hypothetical protein
MRKAFVIVFWTAVLAHPCAENISAYGTVEGKLGFNSLQKGSPLNAGAAEGYSLDNYLLFNANAKLSAGAGAFAMINADVLFQESVGSQDNQEQQRIAPTLNEAYLSVPFADFLILTLGKRRIVWGTGLSYNPGDFINPPKDPLNPLLEKRGVYSAMLELFTEWLSVTQAAVIYDQLDHFGYGTKLSTSRLIPSTDISLIFYYSPHAQLNLGAGIDSTPFGQVPVLENLALHAEAGFSQTSERLVYNESALRLTVRESRPDFYKNFLTGMRYTIPGWETLIAAEYFHIDDGYSPAELGAILDHGLVTRISYAPGLMCRNNLMISITQPQLTQRSNSFTDTLAVSAAMLLNLEDSSFIITAKIESSMIANCLFSLETGYFAGGKATEYGISPREYYFEFSAAIGF